MLYPNELRARSEKKNSHILDPGIEFPDTKTGRGGGIRTPDILLPKQARYQTALHPEAAHYSGSYLPAPMAFTLYQLGLFNKSENTANYWPNKRARAIIAPPETSWI
jgi:hypothetical protein